MSAPIWGRGEPMMLKRSRGEQHLDVEISPALDVMGQKADIVGEDADLHLIDDVRLRNVGGDATGLWCAGLRGGSRRRENKKCGAAKRDQRQSPQGSDQCDLFRLYGKIKFA